MNSVPAGFHVFNASGRLRTLSLSSRETGRQDSWVLVIFCAWKSSGPLCASRCPSVKWGYCLV